MHGGNHARGVAHHSTTHGRYSRSLPLRLAGSYAEALADADLLSTREDAALVTSLVEEQLQKLDTGETGAHWARLQDAWTEYEKAGEKDREHKLWRVGSLIADGAREAEAVREIRSALLDRARLAESERKRLVEAHQVISAERLLALVGALSAAILEEVPDRERRARILERFDHLLSAGSDGTTAA
jgi:hypothetical protein